jgi:hypothetical protein
MGRIAGLRTVTRVGAAGCLLAGCAVVGAGAAGAATTASDPLPVGQAAEGLSEVLSEVAEPGSLDAGGGPTPPRELDPLQPLDGATGRLGSLLPGDDDQPGGEDPGTEEPAADGGDDDGGDDVGETAPAETSPGGDGAPAAAVDAGVEGLLGACVRVPREGTPVKATLVVLDHDLIATLTDAGLPLEELETLVVPCPEEASVPEAAVTPPGASTPAPQAPSGDRPASAVPSLPDRLAYTGADTVPLASLAVALLSLGALLGRGARRLRPCASRG